jgi:hypothetical protein
MEFITFDEEKHQYTNARTGEVLPSVTQIINAVYGSGLEKAPSKFVERAAEKGTIIHKEIDTYLTKGTIGETTEFQTWLNWSGFSKKKISCAYLAEHIVSTDTKYGSFAGTVDFFANGFIYDWKTSKTATRKQVEKWQMQLSMYCYALRKMGNIVNEPLKVVHITDNVEIINVDYLGDEWVENTVKMYYEGQKIENKPETSLQTVDEQTLAHFGNVLKQIADLEKSIEPIREQIKAEMEKRGILNLKLGNVSISYVAHTKRKTFDTKRFKADNAEMYEQYTKESEVKSSIRIKVEE